MFLLERTNLFFPFKCINEALQINSVLDILGAPASKEMQIQQNNNNKKFLKRKKPIQLIKMMSCSALIVPRVIPAWVQVFLGTQFRASRSAWKRRENGKSSGDDGNGLLNIPAHRARQSPLNLGAFH